MKSAYLNDEFFSRLETLALNLRADLNGYFGGKHFVRSYGQTVEFADYREYQLGDDIHSVTRNQFQGKYRTQVHGRPSGIRRCRF